MLTFDEINDLIPGQQIAVAYTDLEDMNEDMRITMNALEVLNWTPLFRPGYMEDTMYYVMYRKRVYS